MTISIKKTRPATSEEWDFIWKNCDYSTYFHSREWAEIWNSYNPGIMHPEPKMVIFSDGKEALLPLSSWDTPKGLTKNFISSPAGTYGGWIAAEELHLEHAAALAGYLTKKCGNISWRLNPYEELAFKTKIRPTRDDETQTLDLTEGFEVLYKRWTKGHRSAAQKARREGVGIKPASAVEDWQAYYQTYEDSMRRWGEKATSRYRWELFETMFRRNSPFIKLWLAVYREAIVGGALCFYAKKHVVYWHGATLEEYFALRPNHLLMYECIKAAFEEGYKWFDFNPSGGFKGVKAFKEGFGTKALKCPVIEIETTRSKIIKKLKGIFRYR